MRPIQTTRSRLAAFIFSALFLPLSSAAQSTDANFPTAVTTNEINGTIKARDIGDSRLTSYFYAFDGGQGDIFINVVTRNFTGDIDIFAAEALRPLTKMVVYAEAETSETGRLIYLRKPERLILRVEGRSPNDDPAIFRIKFGGSFIALAEQRSQEGPAVKGTEANPESGVRVNSVGTIVEVLPKPQPSPKATPEAKESSVATVVKTKHPDETKEPPVQPAETSKEDTKESASTAKVVEKKPAPTKPPAKLSEEVAKKESTPAKKPTKKTDSPEVKTVFNATKPKSPTVEKPTKPPPVPPEKKPDPLASIRLVVQLKDGKIIERPMSDVQKFSVDNGILTVIAKDGTTFKYSILDVAKVTIE